MSFNEKEIRNKILDLLRKYRNMDDEKPVFDFWKRDLDQIYDAPNTKWGKEFRVRSSRGAHKEAYCQDFKLLTFSSNEDIRLVKEYLKELKRARETTERTVPDPNTVLSSLKDFQRATVDYIFHKMYKEGHDRFLVADEVGLGKTLVARGITAKAVSHLWNTTEEDGKTPRRIDVIYICSNSAIARQNINKLTIPGITEHIKPTRITLLAENLPDFDDRLNFIALTPSTSFDFSGGTGWVRERAMLFILLKEIWGIRLTDRNINFFRDGASYASFEQVAKELEDQGIKKLNREIKDSFDRFLGQDKSIKVEYDSICYLFNNDDVSDDKRRRRRDLIMKLRQLLAKASIAVLKPDVIILDEFQRFRDILGNPDEAEIPEERRETRQLVHDLLNQKAAKVLLLSATPYKMYTIHEDVEGVDHYREFIETVDFLFKNDAARTARFKELLSDYRYALLSSKNTSNNDIMAIKGKIEAELKTVMVRTERYGHIKDPAGLIEDGMAEGRDIGRLTCDDLASYIALKRIAEEMEIDYVMEYWKSAPYLFNFMDEYVSKQQFDAFMKNPRKAYDSMAGKSGELLEFDKINRYEPIPVPNTQMRTLLRQTLGDAEAGPWQLLWMPPTVPYWTPGGVFNGKQYTKTIVFSKLRVVPKSIGLIASYEYERRVFKGQGNEYFQERRVNPPLVFDKKPGEDGDSRLTRMSNFTLLYPSYTLAKQINPLEIAKHIKEAGGEVNTQNMVKETAATLKRMFSSSLMQKKELSQREDLRWYWAVPYILDSRQQEIQSSYAYWKNLNSKAYVIDEDNNRNESSNFKEYLQQLYSTDAEKLGKMPEDLWEVLAKIALGSPAVISLRSIINIWQECEPYILEDALCAASKIAMAFRTMFNQPEAVTLLRGTNELSYWQNVLDYALNGNLQAVMDEYLHVLVEVEGLYTRPPVEAIGEEGGIGDKIAAVVALRTSNGLIDEYVVDHENKSINVNTRNEGKPRRMRYNYCMPFGQQTDSPDKGDRDEKVRNAFNSPFRPFMLASTSIGQEGLDFHLYCHSIFHWHLPSNPIDLEQREGRINRYKGHVIRKNIAEGADIYELDPKINIWNQLFKAAEKEKDRAQCDMIPYWIFEKGKSKIQRHIPSLPMGEDLIEYRDIKNTLVSYRIAFGQPRQQDLLECLGVNYSQLDGDAIERMLINLSPQKSRNG